MSDNEKNKSEVARIRQQIAAEHESAQRAMGSFAYGTAQHSFITKRMEQQGHLFDYLKEIVGEDEAIKMYGEALKDKGKDKEVKDDGKE